jgi:hypothetical protein
MVLMCLLGLWRRSAIKPGKVDVPIVAALPLKIRPGRVSRKTIAWSTSESAAIAAGEDDRQAWDGALR